MILSLAISSALATPAFDPSSPDAVFSGEETFTEDGTIRLWAEIARYDDPDPSVFGPAVYNEATAWPDQSVYAPWIAQCFGTTEPPTSSFLLHVAPTIAFATGTPILFVPGAADNASRGFVAMMLHMDTAGRPAFAITFAHPHGDVLEQAETVADAIAVVKARTGASRVDVVSHSKGGMATAAYLSDLADTAYRGDVRRAVFIATPLGGIDTTYRWPDGNFAALDSDLAFSPTSWSTYYPYTTGNPYVTTDLSNQDFLPDGDDLFPGHRQLLARQAYDLPGELPFLGAYSLQQDWYTTYEGGLGYYSNSEGIDAAIEAGGDFVARLHAAGVDPSVELFTLAGENPLMANGTTTYLAEMFGEEWADLASQGADAWSELVAELVDNSLLAVGISRGEVQGLASGDLVLGEVSGPSDGLVFVSSATDATALTARGAEVVESKVVNLSHLELLYASPITGQILLDDAGDDPTKAWEAAIGERYIEADTLGWVERVLADDEVPPDDTGDPDDTGAPADDTGVATDDTASEEDTDDDVAHLETEKPAWNGGCGGCSGAPGSVGAIGVLTALALVGKRRRLGPSEG